MNALLTFQLNLNIISSVFCYSHFPMSEISLQYQNRLFYIYKSLVAFPEVKEVSGEGEVGSFQLFLDMKRYQTPDKKILISYIPIISVNTR